MYTIIFIYTCIFCTYRWLGVCITCLSDMVLPWHKDIPKNSMRSMTSNGTFWASLPVMQSVCPNRSIWACNLTCILFAMRASVAKWSDGNNVDEQNELLRPNVSKHEVKKHDQTSTQKHFMLSSYFSRALIQRPKSPLLATRHIEVHAPLTVRCLPRAPHKSIQQRPQQLGSWSASVSSHVVNWNEMWNTWDV